jgi:hypothetical protein
VVLGLEFRAAHLAGRYSTTWAMPLVLKLPMRKHLVKWADWCPRLHYQCVGLFKEHSGFPSSVFTIYTTSHSCCSSYFCEWYLPVSGSAFAISSVWMCSLFTVFSHMKTCDGRKDTWRKRNLRMCAASAITPWEMLIEIPTISFSLWGTERENCVQNSYGSYFLPFKID